MTSVGSHNIANWHESFDRYVGQLNDAEGEGFERVAEWKTFTVNGMFGKYECSRYNSDTEGGEVKICHEFRQQCKKCNGDYLPKYDSEATDRAILKVVDRILKNVYGIQRVVVHSDQHSRPKPRQTPHDSARCEACKKGVCSQMGYLGLGNGRPRRSVDYVRPEGGERINWTLTVGDGVNDLNMAGLQI